MKLPSEKVLWKTASIGLGLIFGVAIISIMNQINYMFYPLDEYHSSEDRSELISEYFSNLTFLTGKIISLITGSFFAGAIARLFHADMNIKGALFIGCTLTLLGLFDVITSEYPNYYNNISLLMYIPSAIFGYYFIKKRQQKKTI